MQTGCTVAGKLAGQQLPAELPGLEPGLPPLPHHMPSTCEEAGQQVAADQVELDSHTDPPCSAGTGKVRAFRPLQQEPCRAQLRREPEGPASAAGSVAGS